ncbi:MAG TPA: DUF4440 domain-containing protein [Bacteroidota bacterium]|nr:DUF4440 domain-containing protein [Bacteroidota bacterium]
MKFLAPVILCSLLIISCAPPPQDAATVRKAIEAINQKMANDMLSGKVDTTYAQYTDDAVSMPDHMPMMRGKAAFRENTAKMLAMGVKFSKVQFSTVDVQVFGQIAYEIGTYDMTLTMGSMPEMNDKGKYLTIYQQAADGSWKTKVETWNSDAPPPMPPAAK